MSWSWIATNVLPWVLGGGFITSLVALLRVRSSNRKLNAEAGKTGADAAAVLSSSAVALLPAMNTQVAQMEARLTAANNTITELEGKLRSANTTIREMEGRLGEVLAELESMRKRIESVPGDRGRTP